MLKRFFLCAVLLLPYLASGQKMTIRGMELVNDKLVVQYEIEDSNPNNEYLVSLYSSKDNFAAPVTKVAGDIGAEVKPGLRRAEWSIREEFGNFKGPLSVEIRANVFVPFVRLKTFTVSRGYKRGKGYELEWRPGNTNPVHIELFKDNQRLQGELNHPNNGKYTVNFGSNLKPGKKYRLKITDSKHSNDFVYSENFKIRRKVPLLLKVIPLLAGGYLVTQVAGGGGASDSQTLVDPPGEPN